VAERQRIAREMHDVLAHRLSLVAAYAGAMEYRPDSSPQQLAKAAGVVRAGISQALDELRQVITVMGDEEDDLPDLVDLPKLVQEVRDAGVTVDLRQNLRAGDVPAVQGRAAYRVVQEGLTNARKHAPGQPVTVVLDGGPGDGLTIEVTNPGRSDEAKPGLGLAGLAERVRLADGRLTHERTADGFRLAARLPWPA
jgi:signal transduction histidine kinase